MPPDWILVQSIKNYLGGNWGNWSVVWMWPSLESQSSCQWGKALGLCKDLCEVFEGKAVMAIDYCKIL